MTKPSKIFCIGWAKTGTTSVGKAFEMLGYSHTAGNFDLFQDLERGDMARVFAVAERYDAFDDWPWILLYEAMAERYPDAKFILTLRDEEAMVKSYRTMIAQEWKRYDRIRDVRRYIYGFDTEIETNDRFIERVRRHNADVRAYFRDKPGRLLEMDLARGDGWDLLCPFLEVPVPGKTFPHANAAKSRKPLKTNVRKLLVALRSGLYQTRAEGRRRMAKAGSQR